ncbi:DNA polymerase alpha subunit B-like [Corticium candelabrum]|uniref:DNA polymerase alpha subunit B-like n=1 Tax=Corticium candelabrum TaxID=121492 RepID=UPI002E2609A4|nr:DNA polymerase alpha subunit B-like [Corticium candelabrum]
MEVLVTVGRICCDAEGKMNSSSVLLEGSLKTSGGQSVHLSLSGVEEYSLFPGQVVNVEGRNGSGTELAASTIQDDVALDRLPLSSQLTEPLSVVVSCGPFSTFDNLLDEPLNELIGTLDSQPPDILILIGPFVDAEHPLIKDSKVNKTFDELFKVMAKDKLDKMLKWKTSVLVVPSLRDVHHHCVYPQPPLQLEDKYENVYFLSNPSTVSLKGVTFGITSTDVLFHLGNHEINKGITGDRLGRLCHHLLKQQSYYPLYPPHKSVSIDYEQFMSYGMMPVAPHVLLLPSDLRVFTKDVAGTLCVNPGRLAKRHGGGTYARLMIFPETASHGSIISSTVADVVRV